MSHPMPSSFLATTSSSMETTRKWLLGEDIATLVAKNDRWGRKCGRPTGDDIDELNKISVREHHEVSLAHHDGVVISASSYPESADCRDSIAVPLNVGPITCYDQGETKGILQPGGKVDRISVLGVSHYCDANAEIARRMWEKYASMAAAACAKRIVIEFENGNHNQELNRKANRE